MNVKWRVKGGDWRTHEEQRLAAYRLLAELIGGEAIVEHDGQGAPYLPSRPDLYVSVSHCRRAVAVAVSAEGRVGIDVESRRKVSPSLMERVCSESEREALSTATDRTMAFLQLWTRKEAVLKMRGTGIVGFGSMVAALGADGGEVRDLETGIADVVASVAWTASKAG